MSFAASVGLLIICMITQGQAELKVGDVANQDLCCRIIHGHGEECSDELEPVCLMMNPKYYIPVDNMCKLCGAYGNTTFTIVEIGDNLRRDWPSSCSNGEVGGYGQAFKPGGKYDKYDV